MFVRYTYSLITSGIREKYNGDTAGIQFDNGHGIPSGCCHVKTEIGLAQTSSIVLLSDSTAQLSLAVSRDISWHLVTSARYLLTPRVTQGEA